MKKLLVIVVMMLVVLSACGSPAPTATPNSVPPTAVSNATGATQNEMATFVAQTVEARNQIGTFVAQTVEAQQPTAAPPTATQSATAQPTAAITADQNWGGTMTWFGEVDGVNLIIQKVDGSSFTGAMAWSFKICRVTERVQGDIIQDITTATEQNRIRAP